MSFPLSPLLIDPNGLEGPKESLEPQESRQKDQENPRCGDVLGRPVARLLQHPEAGHEGPWKIPPGYRPHYSHQSDFPSIIILKRFGLLPAWPSIGGRGGSPLLPTPPTGSLPPPTMVSDDGAIRSGGEDSSGPVGISHLLSALKAGHRNDPVSQPNPRPLGG